METVRDICSVMRAIPYYEEGTIKIVQDAPKDHANPSALSFDYVFNNGNVINGDFLYSGSSSKTRFNVLNISYFVSFLIFIIIFFEFINSKSYTFF